MKKLLFFLLILSLFVSFAWAVGVERDLVEIGTGTDVGKALPMECWRTYSYTQSLFLQSEINVAGKQIDKLYYHFNGNSAFTDDIVVYMGHTTQNTLSDWIPMTEMSMVYVGPLTTLATDSWIEIDLTIPFVYNNIDNLVIAFDDNSLYHTNSDEFYCTDSGNNMSIYYNHNSTNPDPADPPAVGTVYYNAKVSTYRPNIRLELGDLATEPQAVVIPESGYFEDIATGSIYDPYGETFQLFNAGAGTLTVTSVADLSGTDFITTFDETEVSLTTGESYSFGFTYAPTVAEYDSVYFEIETNGGIVGISLTGDAHQLPEGMVEIGPGLIKYKPLPYELSQMYSYAQSLFLQSEIYVVGEQIEKIYYHFDGGNAFTDNIVVYMGHTTQNTLTDWVPLADLTQVYDDSLTFIAEDGWVEIELQVPFVYNYSDNLVIAVDDNTGQAHYGCSFYSTETDSDMSIHCKHYDINFNPDPASPPAIGTGYGDAKLITYRPNIRLQFEMPVLLPPQNLAVTELGYATWEAPGARDFVNYKVYLDSVLVDTTSVLFWQYEGLVNGQTYLAAVSAQYDEGESELIEYEFTFNLGSPQNLAVTELGYATWEAPGTRDFLNYNVYLDSVLVDTTTALFWQYEDLVNGQTYLAAVSAQYDEGESDLIEYEFTYTGTGSDNDIVAKTELNGNYPNPFNPETTISFTLTTENTERNTEIVIYNLKGQKVRTLINEKLAAGHHSVVWNGKDDNGSNVASGVYFYRMKADRYTATRKMILMK